MLSNKFKKDVLFVMDDPFGKAFLDDMLYNSWLTIKKTLISILGNHKLIMSCRNSVIYDVMSRGTFNFKSNIVAINDLTDDEKRNILDQYASHLHASEKECYNTIIAKVDKHFPLLCKLYFKTDKLKNYGLRFFEESVNVLKEDIKDYKNSRKEIYFVLLLLVLWNDNICIDDIIENKLFKKKFEHALELCKFDQNQTFYFIRECLVSLTGFLVRKICNIYQFNHDFVMEVTKVVIGTESPKFIILNADIGLLRKFVRIENCSESKDPFIIYLNQMNIGDLGKRFFTALFEESLLEVVLNPCMGHGTVIEILKEEIKDNPGKLEILLKKREHISEKQRMYWSFTDLKCSKLAFLAGEKEISPICALIVLSHTDLSLYCLNSLHKRNVDFTHDGSVFSAVCCNGSIDLFNMFSKEYRNNYFTNKWQFLLPIHIVSMFHNYELLSELIQIGVDVNFKTDNYAHWTPLQLAAGNATEKSGEESSNTRRDKTVHLLLKHKANISICDDFGNSPLHAACENGYESTVQILLRGGADFNLCTTFNSNPIKTAHENERDNVVQKLTETKANLNLCNKMGNSPLHLACENGHEKVVHILLKNCEDINICNYKGHRPFDEACANGHDRIVHIFLQKDFDIKQCNDKRGNPLHIASANGQNHILQILLERGADINFVNEQGNSPLYVACEKNNVRMVEILLNNEADINLCNNLKNSPLHVACENGFVRIVEVLLNNNPNVNLLNNVGNSPLYVTCEKGFEHIFEMLLRKRADFNLCNHYGNSPLHVACKKGHKRIMKMLLKHHANVNLFNKIGNTPLYEACHYKHRGIVQSLLQKGADVNLSTEGGDSPLHISCEIGDEETVKILLKTNKAHINKLSKNFGSPLHLACKGGYENTVKLLLKYEANGNLCNIYGESPLRIAEEHGHERIVQILQDKYPTSIYEAIL